MQALRLASRWRLRAWIDDGTLCVLQGDRLVYKSDLLSREVNWQSHIWNDPDTERLLARGGRCPTVLLTLRRGTLFLDEIFYLDLHRGQHALVARWLARICASHNHLIWQRCAQRIIARCQEAQRLSKRRARH